LVRENVSLSDLIKYNPQHTAMNVVTQFKSISGIAMAHAGKMGKTIGRVDIEHPDLKLPVIESEQLQFSEASSATLSSLVSSTAQKDPKTFMLKDGVIDLQGFKLTEDGVDTLTNDGIGMPKKTLLKYALLGKGACGQVHAALHLPTFNIVAVKEISFSERSARHQAVREMRVLWENLRKDEAFCHEIVALYDAYLDSEMQCVSLVMEYMNGGSLQDIIDQHFFSSSPNARSSELHAGIDVALGICNEGVLANIASDILTALKFIHEMNLVHLDIKPANILLNIHGKAKLADFGLAKRLESDKQYHANTFIGTMKYMSPERLKGEKYSYASDIWSLVLTLMTCTLGKYPFLVTSKDEVTKSNDKKHTGTSKLEDEDVDSPNREVGGSVYWSLLEIFRKGSVPLLPKKVQLGDSIHTDDTEPGDSPSFHEFSDEYIDFLNKGLQCDPSARPTASELLQHPWIQKHQSSVGSAKRADIPAEVLHATRSTLSTILCRANAIPGVLYVTDENAAGQVSKVFPEQKLLNLAEQLDLPLEVVKIELLSILSNNTQ